MEPSYNHLFNKLISHIKQKYDLNVYYHNTDDNYIVFCSFYPEFYSNPKIIHLSDQLKEDKLIKTLGIKIVTIMPAVSTFLNINILVPKDRLDIILTYFKLIADC